MDILRGLTTAPWLVALMRGLVEAVVLAALFFVASWLTSSDVPTQLVPLVPLLLTVIRTIEGLADQIDPAKQRVPAAANDAGDAQTMNTRGPEAEG